MSELSSRFDILGGGQLGRMLTEAAIPVGVGVRVLETKLDCPAAQVGAEVVVGSIKDPSDVRSFALNSRLLGNEIEHFATTPLIELQRDLGDRAPRMEPHPLTVAIIQDKLRQKQHFRAEGVPVADFMDVPDREAFHNAIEEFGDVLLKTRFGGYDGRGIVFVEKGETYDEAVRKLGTTALYAERRIAFKRELSALVARDRDGNTVNYPLVQTLHRNGICDITRAPANISMGVAGHALGAARLAVQSVWGAGVYAVEEFETEDTKTPVLVNEMAPRVHNSGHWTIDGSRTSQFEQHIRAVTGLPLGPTEMTAPAAVMINILSENPTYNGRTLDYIDMMEALKAVPHMKYRVYGKENDISKTRKVGHINILAESIEEAEYWAKVARTLVPA